MAITAKEVNELRQMTGAGMMDCKKALTEANGDFDAAIDFLRKKGQKVSASRAGRETSEGAIFVKTKDDNKVGYLVAISCETDFVARNEDFQKTGDEISQVAADKDVSSAEELLEQSIGDKTIKVLLTEMMGKIGEKIEIKAFEKLEADKVISYVHSNFKLGVLVALNGVNGSDVTDMGRDIAMQIAAMNPIALDKDDVPKEVVDRELQVGKEQAAAEGKPEKMLDKIAEGKLNKYFKENTLLNQQFVKDNTKTIADVVKGVDANLSISAFKRVSID